MTEPEQSRPSVLPIITALALVFVALTAVFALRFFRGGDTLPDDAAVGRAVVGQNDALQRGNYTDFQSYTCAAQQGIEGRVLADQKQSVSAEGARYVDDVKDVNVTGDSATATVVYHFEKSPADKVGTQMFLVRENGAWKVCSPGPK